MVLDTLDNPSPTPELPWANELFTYFFEQATVREFVSGRRYNSARECVCVCVGWGGGRGRGASCLTSAVALVPHGGQLFAM